MMKQKRLIPEVVEEYADHVSNPMPAVLSHLAQYTTLNTTQPQMLCGPAIGNFLRLVVSIQQAKDCLEIGTFTGYSSLCIASALPPEGRLVTCDINAESAAMAQQAFDRSPDGHKIRLHVGNALDLLPTFQGPFDFAFIDANSRQCPDYYEAIVLKMRPGGVMVIDNMLLRGNVFSPQSRESEAIAELNERIAQDPRVDNTFLTVRDGLQLIRVK